MNFLGGCTKKVLEVENHLLSFYFISLLSVLTFLFSQNKETLFFIFIPSECNYWQFLCLL